MRSILAGLRQLVLPWGAKPGTPRIVAGPNVPATLAINQVTVNAAVLWYFDADSYYFIAIGDWTAVPGVRVVVKGTYDINGITVFEVNRPQFDEMVYGSNVFDSNHPSIKYRDVDVVIESTAALDVATGSAVGVVQRVITHRSTSSSVGAITAEKAVFSVGLPLKAGRTYWITVDCPLRFTVATDQFQGLIREDTVSGNQLQRRTIPITTTGGGTNTPCHLEVDYTPATDENKTFVFTVARVAGTGTATPVPSDFAPAYMYVDCVEG